MKVISVKVIVILATVALVVAFFWPVEKGPACYQTSDEQVREFVKNDYLQRIKRWVRDAQLLGSETPKITWVEKIQRYSTDVEDEKTLLVPFKAEGPKGKIMYFGMYHCEEGYVEYASN